MQTLDIRKIIETSTARIFQYELTQLSNTLWVLSGSLPTMAIKSLFNAGFNCYMAENEFFISAIGVKEEEN